MPHRRRRREGEEINISPLIDMTFLLLIFFMVSSTFVRDLEIDLERPGARSAAPADTRALRVTIDREGEVYVDARQVPAWMVESYVREHILRTGIDDVLIVSDRRAESGRLVEVVDQCRVAGAAEVGVAVEGEG